MKKVVSLLALGALMLSASARTARNPNPESTGLINPPANAIAISQSDFDNGTYRITQPGYYYLTENIEFDPIVSPPSSPPFHLGWPAVLAIEADNVTLNLNNMTIQIAESFLPKQHFGSIIQLNNQPFPTGVGGFGTLVTPKNILITNGTIGRSRHHGIHGNNNTNARFHNLVIRDFETAAIALNAASNGEIKHVMIRGNEHAVPITGLGALFNDLKKALDVEAGLGDTTAATHATNIQALIDNGDGLNPGGISDVGMYGIFLNEAFSVGEFSTDDSNGSVDTFLIEDVTISNMETKTVQTVGIQDAVSGELLKDTPGFTLRWVDAFDGNGDFAPNDILKAQVYLTNKLAPSTLPAGFAANILAGTPDEATFLAAVKPAFGFDNRGHVGKGILGLRLEAGKGIIVRNCQINNVNNRADAVDDLSTIPAGDNYSFTLPRSIIADTYGISMSACSSCHLENVEVINCASSNGNCYGVMVRNNSISNVFDSCSSKNNTGAGATLGSTAHVPSHVYGFRIENGSHTNQFTACTSESHSAPYACYGFSVEGSDVNRFAKCTACNVVTTGALSSEQAKRAIGFESSDCMGTLFDDCRALGCNDDSADTEAGATELSTSQAIGFSLAGSSSGSERDAIVSNCIACSNSSQAGSACGILIKNATRAMIDGNTLQNNRGRGSVARGFGLCKNDHTSDALIVKNFAYANSTQNYKVLPEWVSIPVIQATAASMSSLKSPTGLDNISIS